MTAPAAQLQRVDAVLRITAGPRPFASYTCHRCDYYADAQGRNQVRAFVSHIRTTHRANCPRKDT